MEKKRIIFADKNAVARAPMVTGLLSSMHEARDFDVLSRGILVQFPEPINPKVESLLISNGIDMSGYVSKQLEDSDITESTTIFVMEEKQKEYIIDKYENANPNNTFSLSAFVGEELEIIDPYGGTMQAYGICFESMKSMIQKLVKKMEDGDL